MGTILNRDGSAFSFGKAGCATGAQEPLNEEVLQHPQNKGKEHRSEKQADEGERFLKRYFLRHEVVHQAERSDRDQGRHDCGPFFLKATGLDEEIERHQSRPQQARKRHHPVRVEIEEREETDHEQRAREQSAQNNRFIFHGKTSVSLGHPNLVY